MAEIFCKNTVRQQNTRHRVFKFAGEMGVERKITRINVTG
jgi:hypothetical protein